MTLNVDLLQDENEALRIGDSASSSDDDCEISAPNGKSFEGRRSFESGLNDVVVIGDTLNDIASVEGLPADDVRPVANSAFTSDLLSLLIPREEGFGTKNPESRPDLVALLVLKEALRMNEGAFVSEVSIRPVHGAAPCKGDLASSSKGIPASSSWGWIRPEGSAISMPRS